MARVTVIHDGRRRVLAGVDPAAQALGLRPGLVLAHAMAMVPGLDVAEAEPDEDDAALQRLAGWCRRYTPLTATSPADGLWLDVSGCAHLWGGEAGMVADLLDQLQRQGLHARAAVADTPGAAHAVARYGLGGVVAPGAHADAVSFLPVAALRLPSGTVATLRHLGLDRIADLARIPRAAMARRFGPAVGLRLDQAYGPMPEPIVPLVPAELMQHRITFVEPLVTPEALSKAIACLMMPLCERMEQGGLGARRLDLLFERVDGAVQAIRTGTARPSCNVRHLCRLLDEQLEKVDPGLGVEAMRLVIPLAEPLRWCQDGALGADATSDVASLVDRLCNRLGAERVYRAEPVESDVPERSVRRVPALAQLGGISWPSHFQPIRLLHPPRPVDAMSLLPDHPPVAFTWQRKRHRVRYADGPERIHGEWWRRDAELQAVRDYFRLEDEDGRRFWLFRQGDGMDPATGGLRWFLHGLF